MTRFYEMSNKNNTHMSSSVMTPEEAQQFKNRWRRLNEYTAQEAQCRMSAQRLETLGRLSAAGKVLRRRSGTDDDRQVTYAVWQKLRERMGCLTQKPFSQLCVTKSR